MTEKFLKSGLWRANGWVEGTGKGFPMSARLTRQRKNGLASLASPAREPWDQCRAGSGAPAATPGEIATR